MVRVASSILLVTAVVLLLMAPAACKAATASARTSAPSAPSFERHQHRVVLHSHWRSRRRGWRTSLRLALQPPESGNCLDMDGSTGTAGQISRAMMSLAPGTYTLSFDLIGSQRGLTTSTTVTLGSLFNQTFILGSSDVTAL
jgi:hypothetical protein